jgi:hypothetical protein
MSVSVTSPSYDTLHIINAWRDNNIRLVFTQGEGLEDSGIVWNNDGTVNTEETAQASVTAGHVKVLRFQLRDGLGKINLTSCEVVFAITRPDGSEDLLACQIEDASDGIVSCPVTSSATAIPGNADGEIRVLSSNSIVKFYGIHLMIHEGVSDSAVEQSQPFSALTEALQKVLVMTPEGTVEIDDEITENGENPVSSGTIYDYVNGAIEDYAGTVDQELDDKADLTNKVFKMEHLGVLFPSIQNGLPNVDTTNNTLTLHKDTSLLLVSTSGSTQTRVLAPNGDVVIDYSSIASSAIKIYYDLTNDRFNVLAYNGVPSQNDILICSIRDTSSFGTSNHGMSISCPYTVDGKLFGVNITEYIANNSITESKLATAFTQKLITNNSLIAKIEHLGVIMPSVQGGFPELDTVNNTLTLHKNTSLMLRSVTDGETQFVSLAGNTDVVVDYSSIASSAVKIYFNLSTNTLRGVAYSTAPGSQDVLICTIRDVSQWGLTNHCMSISCPYIIDGKLFGVNLSDYIDDNSITEAQLSTAYKLSVQNSIDEINTYASGINSYVNSLKKLSLINLIKSATFEKGTLNNGVEAVSTTRIRSAFINISDVRSLQVSANSGYKYSLHFYDSNGTFVSSSFGNIYWHWVDWQTESYFIPILPAVKYVRIVISDTSNSENITLNDSSKIKVLADYSEYRQFQFLNNFCGKLQESIVPHNNWVNAATDGGSGLDYSSTRICSGLIELPKSGIININTATGYEACYVIYGENMTRIKAAGYSTSCTAEIGNNYKWIVVFVKVDSGSNVDISPSAGNNCTISYIPTDNMQFVENTATSAATSATINAITNAENIQHIDDIVANSTVDISWEYGIIWQGFEGDGNPKFTRIRSGYIPVGKGTRVRCAAGYQHIVFKFDLQKNWISNPNWTPNEIVVDQDCLIRITVAKSDDSVISESEITTIGNSETIIRELPQYIADNVLDFSDRIPSYYNTQLKAAINSAIDNIVSAGISGESFIFFSDPHWEGNAKWSPALIKEITKQTNINTIICGGDLIEGGNKAAMVKAMNDMISRFKGSGRFFVAFGNHDTNTIGSGSTENHLTKGETYALMQKQSDFDVQYGELCYYYFDNPTTKTRFIVLDTGIDRDAALDSTQRTWFQTTLNNMPTGYHALIFAHIIYISDNWRVGMSALEFNRTTFMDEICTICDTFNSANNGKKVEAMFGGHTHFDLDPNLDPNPDPQSGNRFTSTGGIPIIIIDCDTVTTASADGQGNRNAVKGTITEQCFDIVTVDYSAKQVKCIRIGRGSDRTISY